MADYIPNETSCDYLWMPQGHLIYVSKGPRQTSSHFMMTSSSGNIFGVTGPLGIHPSLVIFPHKGQWRGALTFSLICASTNDRINNRTAGNLRGLRDHYVVSVISCVISLLMRKSELLFCIYQYRRCQNEIDCVDLVIFVWVEIIGLWNLRFVVFICR